MKTASPADLGDIDRFCDTRWLEDGPARAALDSYRTDLGQCSLWRANNAAKIFS